MLLLVMSACVGVVGGGRSNQPRTSARRIRSCSLRWLLYAY
jgi:hypothetical protein